MSELIWINGEVMPLADARISVEDRGFQFADGVYEVIRLYNGKPFTLHEHLQRLARSAVGIQLTPPISLQQLAAEITKFAARATASSPSPGIQGEGRGEGLGLRDAMIYLQMTRGTSPRNHAFPDCKPTLLFYARALEPLADPEK